MAPKRRGGGRGEKAEAEVERGGTRSDRGGGKETVDQGAPDKRRQ